MINQTLIWIVLGGAALGVGLTALVGVLAPERPDLVDALGRDRSPSIPVWSPPAETVVVESQGLSALQVRLEKWLSKLPVSAPAQDLQVIEMTRGSFLLLRLGVVAVALLVAPLYTVIFAVADLGVPILIPAGAAIAAAAVAWLVVGRIISTRAENRRREMRYALVSYLTLVALQRAAGEGMRSALELAANSSPSWTFRRIEQSIAFADRQGGTPWDGLVNLAEELAIDELADLGAIADAAGTGGAAVYSTLLARAKALRNELQTQEEAASAIASARMVMPKVLLGVSTFAFLLYPALLRLGS